MDQILIHGLKVFAYHGVNPEEKRDRQTFVLDVALHTSLRRPGRPTALRIPSTIPPPSRPSCA